MSINAVDMKKDSLASLGSGMCGLLFSSQFTIVVISLSETLLKVEQNTLKIFMKWNIFFKTGRQVV